MSDIDEQATKPANQGGVGETQAEVVSDVKPGNMRSDVRDILPPGGGGDAPLSFAGFPVTKYNPVYGARTVNDPNEAAQIFQPPHNWFATAGEADMHRTDREAQQVIHYNRQVKVDDKVAIVNGDEPAQDRSGIVRNSVQAQQSLDAGTEPVI